MPSSFPRPPPARLLGGLTPRAFLHRYWQKRPLLVRGAWPGFRDPVDIAGLFRLAAREDCEARLVARRRGRWSVEHGPLARDAATRVPARDWTLLVQGLNHFVPAADAMLQPFDFVPRVRVDDVMVSYAARAGGVGPHLDSYDVFLLQGSGRRRWRIAERGDRTLDPAAPLKVLANFVAEREWVLEAGDMLYLPPGVAHEGTALDPCFTYSIGFRAPAARELATEFLAYLQDALRLPERRYADPDLAPSREPARIDDAFVDRCAALLQGVTWKRTDIAEFLGRYFSEPKPHVVFEPPARPLSAAAFAAAAARRGLALAPQTGMLYRSGSVYVNGESARVPPGGKAIAALANARALAAGTSITGAESALLYTWYRAGYLTPADG